MSRTRDQDHRALEKWHQIVVLSTDTTHLTRVVSTHDKIPANQRTGGIPLRRKKLKNKARTTSPQINVRGMNPQTKGVCEIRPQKEQNTQSQQIMSPKRVRE